ncbi:MAG: response regulator, partial [Chloroflexota bacterium]
MKRTRLVVVNPSIAPAVRIKEALERTRRFVVTPFADAFAALDFLRQQKQDMIIIDMGMTDYPGDELIRAVLEIQPDITVVANTSDSGMAASAVTAGAGYLLDERYTAREVLNILEQALEAAEATKDSPDTATPPKVQKPKLTETDTSGSAEVFERIAQEEPTLPDFDESGTVTDFMAISPDDLDEMVNTPPGGVDSVEYIDDDDDDPVSDYPAALFILESAAQDRRALSDLPFD